MPLCKKFVNEHFLTRIMIYKSESEWEKTWNRLLQLHEFENEEEEKLPLENGSRFSINLSCINT